MAGWGYDKAKQAAQTCEGSLGPREQSPAGAEPGTAHRPCRWTGLALRFPSCAGRVTISCITAALLLTGAALVNAHGGTQFQPMLVLLEGYLDRKDVADEARYDKVREGAIVFLGTLARHLDPSDAKVHAPHPDHVACQLTRHM